MAQLHLHVLTDDMVGEALKNKKHYHSFTSAFFLHLDDVIGTLQRGGRVVVDVAAAEALLKQPLVCHVCGAPQPNMPSLKEHLAAGH
jgi:aprataxin